MIWRQTVVVASEEEKEVLISGNRFMGAYINYDYVWLVYIS